MKTTDTNIGHNAGGIVLYAFRYALTRHSYAPWEVSEFIKEHWEDEGVQRVKGVIVRDLNEHIDNVSDFINKMKYKGETTAVDDIDFNTWVALREWITTKEPTKNAKTKEN